MLGCDLICTMRLMPARRHSAFSNACTSEIETGSASRIILPTRQWLVKSLARSTIEPAIQAHTHQASAGLAGSVVEACNSPGGFTVSASYRPLKSNETASLNYGGRLINLTPSGEQELRRSNMATIRTVDYRFEEVELDEPLILSLVIQPI